MKKIFIIPLVLLMTAVLSVGCLAYSPAELEAREYEATKDELVQLAKAAEESSMFYGSLLKSLHVDLSPEEGAQRLMESKAYRTFKVTAYDLSGEYASSGDFGSLLSSDEYWWILPDYEAKTYTDFIKTEDGFRWGGSGTGYNYPGVSKVDFSVGALAERALNSGKMKDVYEIKVFSAKFGDYVYVKADTGEFIVPFLFRPDFTSLKSEQVYTAKEAMEIYGKDFPHITYSGNVIPVGGGGAAERKTERKTDTLPYVIAATAALAVIAAAVVITLIIKRKRS